VIVQIAPISVLSLGRAEGKAARALVEVAPVSAAEPDLPERAQPKACVVALAPAAMSALIEAQEHMARDATPSDRSLTAQKIDQILSRLTDSPAARPVPQAAAGGFPVQMLIAARQQLRDIVA
jgi:hypothetical protein